MMMQGPRFNPLAIASLVCGILAVPGCFCFCGSPLGLAAVITGIIGMQQIRRDPQAFKGHGMALAGIICGGIGMALHLVGLLSTFDDMLRTRLLGGGL
jgi:hypothetical protein